jgi:hypothetical protein
MLMERRILGNPKKQRAKAPHLRLLTELQCTILRNLAQESVS